MRVQTIEWKKEKKKNTNHLDTNYVLINQLYVHLYLLSYNEIVMENRYSYIARYNITMTWNNIIMIARQYGCHRLQDDIE